MSTRTFLGPSLPALMTEVRETVGPDAMIVHVRPIRLTGGGSGYEVAAADNAPPTDPPGRRRTEFTPVLPHDAAGPYRLAVVGPTGAGKTTVLAKLLLHPRVFPGARIAVLGCDTERAGADARLRTYAAIGNCPMAAVYTRTDLDAALRRFRRVDVLLIDMPGHGYGPNTPEPEPLQWRQYLLPDEVHLVLPAGLQVERLRRMMLRHRAARGTHVLVTKLDEAPEDHAPFHAALALGLPMRWVTDGPGVPDALRPATGWASPPHEPPREEDVS